MRDNNIGSARRAYAKRSGSKFTQEDAAKYFNVSIGTYRNWEQGRVDMNSAQISQMADLYGVTVDYLLGVTNIPMPPAFSLTQDEMELLDCYRQVEPWERELILSHAKMVLLHAKH